MMYLGWVEPLFFWTKFGAGWAQAAFWTINFGLFWHIRAGYPKSGLGWALARPSPKCTNLQYKMIFFCKILMMKLTAKAI